MRMVRLAGRGFFLACLLVTSAPVQAQTVADSYAPVTDEQLVDPPDEDWLMWRRSYGHWGHSPLSQINTSNVGTLRLAWA